MSARPHTELPEWSPELRDSSDPVARFVYHNEPAGHEVAEQFRAELAAVIEHVLNARSSGEGFSLNQINEMIAAV